MARSNNVIGTINSVAVLLSVPVFGSGLWLAVEAKKSGCFKISQLPFIIFGILIFVVALSGVIGGFRGTQPLVVFYYIAMIIVIISLITLVIFFSRVTVVQSPGLNLRDFSNFILNVRYSANVSNCVETSNICANLNQSYHTAEDFFSARLTTIQSRCCTPSRECDFTSVNPTNWRNSSQISGENYDCQKWSNDPNILCYKCESCNIGLLNHINSKYKRANLFLIITLVALIIVYSVGCFALKNAKLEDIFH